MSNVWVNRIAEVTKGFYPEREAKNIAYLALQYGGFAHGQT